jgi:hypothetical protein
MGFGQFQLRVKVVTYVTADDQSKVIAFYKNALGRFGDVIECHGNQPVGTPTVTAEGLTCREDSHVNIDGQYRGSDDTGLNLRAGSRHHQHILAFKSTASGTKYSLVELEVPPGLDDHGKTD